VDAARRVAQEVLAPAAEATDRAPLVPGGHLRALAAAGLLGLAGPADAGGAAAGPAVTRAVYESLAGACGVTFFVWVQHHAPVRLLAASANGTLRRHWLAPLCRGDVLGGVAFAYLRRPGPTAVLARPAPGGWVVSGEAPWVTSWGLAGLFAVAARVAVEPATGRDDDDGDVLFFVLAADPPLAAVRASPPLALAAMGASSTVRLSFDDLFVPSGDVVTTLPFSTWRERDRTATSLPHPAPFGVASAAVRLLADHAEATDQPAAAEAASRLAGELDECRAHSYHLVDAGGTDAARPVALVEARAWGLDLAMRSAQALVVAVGGRAMALGHPAQRLLREAAFYSIQAQSLPLRQATLARVTRRQGAPSS
jgi:alkylation response protein AidB-like acyl-CoA dehydrogenase